MQPWRVPIIHPLDAREQWVRVEDGRPVEEAYAGGKRSPWLLGVSQFVYTDKGKPAILQVQRTDLAPNDPTAQPVWVQYDADRRVVHGITHWRYRVAPPHEGNTLRVTRKRDECTGEGDYGTA